MPSLTSVTSMALMASLAIASSATGVSASKVVQITNEHNFCLLMPTVSGQTVGDSEGSAGSYCLKPSSVSGSGTLNSGAIVSAHVIKTDQYIQVTGKLDNSQTNIPDGDEGGQYDNAPKGSEPHSSCAGYGSYLELVSYNEYCIRCCVGTDFDGADAPCNMHNDLAGCHTNIPGDYDDGFTYEDKSSGSSSGGDDDDDDDDDDTTTTTKKTTSSTTSSTTSTPASTSSTTSTTDSDDGDNSTDISSSSPTAYVSTSSSSSPQSTPSTTVSSQVRPSSTVTPDDDKTSDAKDGRTLLQRPIVATFTAASVVLASVFVLFWA